jgi:hypothetical protein
MLNDKQIVFISPTYPPHFEFARRLAISFRKVGLDSQADLFFIFTNDDEVKCFGNIENFIILPSYLRVFENRGIINIKKFYAINMLKYKYKYAIVIDCEAIFIKNVKLYKLCTQFFIQKKLYGNVALDTNYQQLIKSTCHSHFVKSHTIPGDDLYLWFNQLCIYDLSQIDIFFSECGLIKNIANLTYWDFDYYIYMYWLILNKGFKIEDLDATSLFGVAEGYDFYVYRENKMLEYIYACNPRIFHRLDKNSIFCFIQMNAVYPDNAEECKFKRYFLRNFATIWSI